MPDRIVDLRALGFTKVQEAKGMEALSALSEFDTITVLLVGDDRSTLSDA